MLFGREPVFQETEVKPARVLARSEEGTYHVFVSCFVITTYLNADDVFTFVLLASTLLFGIASQTILLF